MSSLLDESRSVMILMTLFVFQLSILVSMSGRGSSLQPPSCPFNRQGSTLAEKPLNFLQKEFPSRPSMNQENSVTMKN